MSQHTPFLLPSYLILKTCFVCDNLCKGFIYLLAYLLNSFFLIQRFLPTHIQNPLSKEATSGFVQKSTADTEWSAGNEREEEVGLTLTCPEVLPARQVFKEGTNWVTPEGKFPKCHTGRYFLENQGSAIALKRDNTVAAAAVQLLSCERLCAPRDCSTSLSFTISLSFF